MVLSRRRRTYTRVPKTDYEYLDFEVSEVTLILGFFEIFEFSVAEMECVSLDRDATAGPVVAPWIV